VGYLNAHGTGTKLGDVAEATAIRTVFDAHPPPVSSTKGLSGHMLGASGVVEAAVSAMAMLRGVLPPTHNLDEPDPACDLDHVRGPRPASPDHVLSNSFGFGGHNISLVLARPSAAVARPASRPDTFARPPAAVGRTAPRPDTTAEPERDARS
jgi:3-oxoacyl-[acyl-carrier-protein] synthase II